jgi:capsule polysaccharide modification protein KpsS
MPLAERSHADMILQPLERGTDAGLLAVELARDFEELLQQVPVKIAGKALVDVNGLVR